MYKHMTVKLLSGLTQIISVDDSKSPFTLEEEFKHKLKVDKKFPFIHFVKEPFVKYQFQNYDTTYCIDMDLYSFINYVGYSIICYEDAIDELNLKSAIAGKRHLISDERKAEKVQ